MRVAKLNTGQAHYSGLLYEHGGFVDDILVHKVADDSYFLCVNASNQEKDYEHIRARQPLSTVRLSLPANAMRNWRFRGRRRRRAQKLTAVALVTIRYYWFAEGSLPAFRRASLTRDIRVKTVSRRTSRLSIPSGLERDHGCRR